MSEQEEAKYKASLHMIAKRLRYLQRNEVMTMHYLGLPYMVLARSPQLRVMVPLSTDNYTKGNPAGIALQLIFTCPTSYPMQLPVVEVAEKRNVNMVLDRKLRLQIDKTLEEHLGLYMIVPVVSRVQMLLNDERRSD